MSLPRSPGSPVRVFTGTSAFTVCGRSPRRARARPSASEEAASRTSLTVAPQWRPASRSSSSGASANATSRRWVSERSSAVGGAGRASDVEAARTSRTGRLGLRSAPATVRAARAAPACATRAAPAAGCAVQVEGPASTPSNSSSATCTAAMPSTSAWWACPTIAQPPPARPSISDRRQSGRSMSQPAAQQPARQGAQLAGASWRSERHPVHVARDVEARIVHPLGAVHAPAKARQPVQASVDVTAQRRERRGGAVELQRPADVQGRLSGLEVEERGVQCAEAIGRRHAARSLPDCEPLKDPAHLPKKRKRTPLRASSFGVRNSVSLLSRRGNPSWTPFPSVADQATDWFDVSRCGSAVWALPGLRGALLGTTKAYLCLGSPSPKMGICTDLDDCTIQSRGGD